MYPRGEEGEAARSQVREVRNKSVGSGKGPPETHEQLVALKAEVTGTQLSSGWQKAEEGIHP